MRRMRTASIVLIVLVAVVCAGAAVVFGTDILKTKHPEEPAATQSPTQTLSPTPSLEPTPTPIPQKPKYIFYIIGDGMGFSHLDLGTAYEKILNEDSAYVPYWDRFQIKRSCEGGIESAKGGTMLATGYDGEMNKISVTAKGMPLTTILDRAKDAGFLTGVISNSYIMDATPAAFLAHVTDRGDYTGIVSQIPGSGVDYLSSGGLNYFLDESLKETFGTRDIRHMSYDYLGEQGILSRLEAAGYSMYLAEEAADFANGGGINGFEKDRLFMLFVSKNMSYRRDKYGSRKKRFEVDEPDLENMTELGIQMLEKDGDGFVFVIEEALIDKASHNMQMDYVASEMHALSETLKVVFDFYEEHPHETLIILTADHETGAFTPNGAFNGIISGLPDINWHMESEELTGFLQTEWGLGISESTMQEKMDFALLHLWEYDEKNYTLLHSYIAAALCEENGIEITSKYHSRQDVPLFAMGVKAELFSECESISAIAPVVCGIMGWEMLPETND